MKHSVPHPSYPQSKRKEHTHTHIRYVNHPHPPQRHLSAPGHTCRSPRIADPGTRKQRSDDHSNGTQNFLPEHDRIQDIWPRRRVGVHVRPSTRCLKRVKKVLRLLNRVENSQVYRPLEPVRFKIDRNSYVCRNV